LIGQAYVPCEYEEHLEQFHHSPTHRCIHDRKTFNSLKFLGFLPNELGNREISVLKSAR
jgi:hypothetical protein